MGKLIVIEGACDGVGKTTQSELLEKRLIRDGERVVKHHFHSRGFDEGQLAENFTKGLYGDISNYSPEWIHNLFAVDRQIIWPTKLKPEYDKGSIILLDRYLTSTLIYQGAMKETKEELKDFIDYVTNQEYNIYGIQKPDLILFLYANFEFAMEQKRRKAKEENVEKDMLEKDTEYMKKVYDTAMFVADYLKWTKIKCDEDNHMRPIEDIHEEIYRKVKKMD